MARATVQQGSKYFFEEGEFLAILREVEEKHVDFTYKSHHKAVQNGKAKAGDPGSFDHWIWKFDLLQGERAGQEITLETDPSVELEGYSMARVAYEALQGEPLELGQDIDTDLVVGMRARLVISHMPERQSGDRVFYDSKITDLLPVRDGDDVELSDEPPF